MTFWSPGTRGVFSQPTSQPFGLPLPIVYEQTSERVRWEYHVVSVDLREEPPLDEERLAALGAEGWLLAGIVPLPDTREATRTLIYYFVRQA
ncbi:MAG TPA: hypothetical protein VF725_05665 [Ktedonobacterales bacterium]